MTFRQILKNQIQVEIKKEKSKGRTRIAQRLKNKLKKF